MENYQSNSFKSKELEAKQPEKKLTKVANAKLKKKSEIQKIAETFVAEDLNKVKNAVLMDVIVPAVKKVISDIVTNGIDMLLYGEVKHNKTTTTSKIGYNSMYNSQNQANAARVARSSYIYNDIILSSRGEAEEVLNQMNEIIGTYGVVSVADLCEIVGVTGEFTDNKYGWSDIRDAYVERSKDGYMLKLPRALPISSL
mgnify:CR=1 FL=1